MEFLKWILLLIVMFCSCQCFAMENAFYILHGNSPSEITATEKELTKLAPHTKLINILISQAYQIGEKGDVSGYVDISVLNFTKNNSIKLMALVTNHDFNREIAHKFLKNSHAQSKAIEALLKECRQYHYYGIQFDFELIAPEDRDLLTQFYKNAAQALHKENYVTSFTIGPTVSNAPTTDVQKIFFKNVSSAFDLKALGAIADFISLMAYGQHGTGTTPGPSATQSWVEQTIKYALQYVPANKLSLGIPTSSGYWSTFGDTSTGKILAQETDMSFATASEFIKQNKITLKWNDTDKNNYAIFQKDWLYEYLFIENEKSFAAKLALVKKYKLRGISVFVLGMEDPNLWQVLRK